MTAAEEGCRSSLGVELGSAAGMSSAEVALQHLLLTYSYGIYYRKNRSMSRQL